MLYNLCLQDHWDNLVHASPKCDRLQSPFATDLFFLFRSTGSKQTLNGLFLFTADYRIYLISLIDLSPHLLQSSFLLR